MDSMAAISKKDHFSERMSQKYISKNSENKPMGLYFQKALWCFLKKVHIQINTDN